jgi:hypothetical protein
VDNFCHYEQKSVTAYSKFPNILDAATFIFGEASNIESCSRVSMIIE